MLSRHKVWGESESISIASKHVLSDDSEAMFKVENSTRNDSAAAAIELHSPESVPHWFAAYTTTRHEKSVAEHFSLRQIESFLPLYRTQRLWKNGCRMNLELPLFPSYIFVRVPRRERVRVLEVPGVLSVVSAAGKPVPLPESEIEALRSSIPFINCEPHPYLIVGEKARVKSGSLAGMEGVLLRKKGVLRVVLSLDLIMQSVAVEVDADNVEPVPSCTQRYKSA
jgi:transcription antitermination factor NusG